MGLGGRSLLLCAAVLAGAGIAGPLRPFVEAALTNHQPQRILVLGGDADRERMGLNLARRMNLPLVVSGGTNPEYARWLMRGCRSGAGQGSAGLPGQGHPWKFHVAGG